MKRLISFFRHKSYWIQGDMARDKEGRPVNLNCFTPETKIESLSLHGAIAHLFSFEREPEKRYKVMDKISQAIQIHTGKSMYIAEFNNRKTTTFEDIVKVLKIADSLR